jgi:hypothetical protein
MLGSQAECPYCGASFSKRATNHVFCKDSCRVRSYRFALYEEISAYISKAETSLSYAREALAKIKAAKRGPKR